MPISSTFKTLKAARSLKASVVPLNGETVGVALPIQIYWNNPVKDRAAVEKRLKVTTSVPVVGTWHWVNNKQVNYRPMNYWPAGTKVTVNIDTQGVNAGNNTWGSSSRKIAFSIGPSVVSKVDVAKRHVMTVAINGKLARAIPITAGKDGFTTRSGVKVIMEKFPTKRMDAATVGIKPGDPGVLQHQRREVGPAGDQLRRVHPRRSVVGRQPGHRQRQPRLRRHEPRGRPVVLPADPARRPVIVTGTARHMEPGNGWTDWNTTWAVYKAGSALS